MLAGIYQISNTITGKRYIGQAADLAKRKRQHFSLLTKGIHDNRHLQSAFNLAGDEAFEFSTLLYCDEFNLTFYEQMLIDNLNPEYNICLECVNSRLSVTASQEQKNKMSEAHKGVALSEDHRNNIGKAHKGLRHSEEAKLKMSVAKKGKKGRPHTKSQTDKIREKTKGQRRTEETKKKMSEAQLKRRMNERNNTLVYNQKYVR